MRDVVFVILLLLAIVLGMLAGWFWVENRVLKTEIEGWSDRVMELERMLED